MRIIATLVGVTAAVTLSACVPAEDPAPVQPAQSKAAGGKAGAGNGKAFPIKLAAKRAKAKPSVLSQGGDLSCAKVVVTNQSKKNVEVNPLYFSLTDTGGTKHSTDEALADYEGQIDTTTLAPGENAKGLVCARGKFLPKQIAMTNPLFSEAARAAVA